MRPISAVIVAVLLIGTACAHRATKPVEVARPELVEIARLLKSEDAATFKEGAKRLMHLGRPKPWERDAKGSGSQSADRALAERHIAPAVVKAMGSDDADLQWYGARALWDLSGGGLLDSLVENLAALLDSEHEDVRQAVAFALCVAGPEADAFLPVVVDHVDDPDSMVSAELVQVLFTRVPASKPHVLEGIRSGRAGVRDRCFEAFALIEWTPEEVVDVTSLLDSPDPELRARAEKAIELAVHLGNLEMESSR